MSTRARDLCVWFLSGLLLLVVPLAVDAKGKKDKKADKEEDAEEQKWEVSNPPGAEFITITIDTEETTWSDVDVSPDGRTFIFEMIGYI